MYPYTTPYHRFKLPVAVSLVEKLYVTYAVNGEVLFEKAIEDCETLGEDTVRIHLRQEETGLIGNGGESLVQVQVTLLTKSGERMTSEIVKLSSGQILKGGEI